MIKIDKLDKREFVIGKENGFEVIMYQAEILRAINIFESIGSDYLAMKWKKVIFIRDYVEGTKTDFKRKVPRSKIAKQILSPDEFRKYIESQRDFEKDMREYYGRKII